MLCLLTLAECGRFPLHSEVVFLSRRLRADFLLMLRLLLGVWCTTATHVIFHELDVRPLRFH